METRRIPEEAQAETQPRTSRKETILIEKKPNLVPEYLIGLQKLTSVLNSFILFPPVLSPLDCVHKNICHRLF